MSKDRLNKLGLFLLGMSLLSGCDVAYINHELGDPAVSHGNEGNAFDLLGVHSQIPCYDCHAAGTFEPLFEPLGATDCISCHQSNYDGEHSGSGYPTTCTDCHTPTVWSDGSLDHTTVSGGFELLGTHTSKPCTVCHDANTFEPLFDPVDANDCVTCHQPDYDDEHSGSGYPTTCTDCHSPTVWSDGSLDHTTVSGGFELLGTHTSKPCTVCHDANTFEPLFDPVDANDCVTCHRPDYDDEHSGSGYPTTCTDCHSPTVWSGGSLDHTTVSGGFELLGTHTSKPCTACHDATTFEPLFNPVDASDCVTCHQPDYDGQHTGSAYPTTCSDCHTPTLWSDGSIDHTTVSGGFELLGTHTSQPCTVCHDANTLEPLFNPVDASDCVTCHQPDYDGQHTGSGYPTTCSDCHTPTLWSDGSIDHTTVSGGFELLGTHTGKPCTVCHDANTLEPLFNPVDASDCVTCHQPDYDGQHTGSGYPTTCSDCHTPTLWSDGSIDHTTVSGGFELLGTHTGKPCTVCHDANTFEPLFNPVDASDCVACHQTDYDGQHTGSGYPTTCSDCHTPTLWSDGSIDHTTVSGGFELLGTHTGKPCTVCHDANTFEPLFNPVDASDCVACHQTDYDGQHTGSGYPTTCSACHTPTVWSDGTFNHTTISSGFELLGTHTSQPCTACHDANTFEPLFSPVDASDCVACHQTDYDGQHTGSGYPTTCSACHTPTVWSDGTFNHTTISSGFELLGTHTSQPCTACHDANTFEPLFSPVDASDCVACHQTDYDGQHTGSGYPTNCTACHTPTAWSNSTLAEPCLTCHGGSPPPGTIFPAPNWSGFDKTTFVGTAHDTQQSGTDSCRNCHAQHGASQPALLLDTYVMSDGNQWTQGDGDYQLCWNCHDEDYVMNQDNAFEGLHDKHVNGEDTPCAMCHDAHAPHDAGESLINFNFSVQNGYDIAFIDGRDVSTSFWRNASDGFCYITCHSKRHDPEDYRRP